MWHEKPNTPRLRVLLVDDDKVVRHVLAAAMTQHGFIVEEAVDGLDALTQLRASPPDVVVTDLYMPRLKGDELCSRLKADPSTRQIPVLMITGSSVDEREIRTIGCDRLLIKPVTGAALTEAVAALAPRHLLELQADDGGTQLEASADVREGTSQPKVGAQPP